MLAFLIACFGLYVVFSAWKKNCDVDSDIIFNPRKSKDIDCEDEPEMTQHEIDVANGGGPNF